MPARLKYLLPALLALLLVTSPPAAQEPGTNPNIRFGMPAPAKASPESREAYLIDRPQYVLSYNDSKKIPNWVCWNITASDIGHTERSQFTEDPDLPAGFRRVRSSDYTGFGFDRGEPFEHRLRQSRAPRAGCSRCHLVAVIARLFAFASAPCLARTP